MARLRTLGRLELVGGEPPATVVIPTQRKRLALLTYLALATPRGLQRRDVLLGLFWPEADQDDARRSLRQALHALRGWLGEGVLQSSRDDQVGLSDSGAWCDAVEFERAIGEGRFTDALALYQGAFLDGVFVTDASPEFEQWADQTRQRLRRSAARAATQLAMRAAGAGDGEGAVRWATVACELAPDDEPSVRRRMEALRDAGDHAGALRIYKVFAQRMADEFEATPAPQTQALRTTLRVADGRALPAPGGNAATSTATGHRPPGVADVAAIERSGTPVAAPVADAVAQADGAGGAQRSHAANSRLGSRQRARWVTLGVAGLGAGLVLYSMKVWRDRAPAPVPDRILVADFRNRTRDSLLGGAVTEALRTDLTQSRLARVMSRSQVQTVLQRMQQPAGDVRSDAIVTEIAEREGVKAIVTGEVAAIGAGYIVSAQLVSVRGGEVLAAVRETAGDSTHLLSAIDAVSARLRQGIGESLWTVRSSPPLEQVTTTSLQALRLYSLAISIGDHAGEDRRAVGLLRQALAADTTFAMAYRKLGVYLRDFDERAGADEALGKAFRYRDRLPEPERYNTIGMYYSNAGVPDSALRAYSILLALYPDDARGLNNIGLVYEDRKEFRRAETFFRRALEGDSSVALFYNHLATVQLNAGEYDAARHTLIVRRQKFAPQMDAEEIEVPLAVMRGDYAEAQRRADRLLELGGTDPGDQMDALSVHAGMDVVRGRLADADRDRRAIMAIGARTGMSGVYLDAAVNLAFADIWYRHQSTRGLRTIDSALAQFPLATIAPLDRDYSFLSYVYALAGRPARARALLAELRANESVAGVTPGGLGLRDEGGYLRSRGATELAEGRASDAVITLRSAVDLSSCPTCALPDLARALEATGQRDSAITTYERYVATPWSDWQLAGGEFRGSAYQRLGALYEARGDATRAIAAYATLADLWSAADSELQPQAADARRRTGALQRARKVAALR